MAIAAAGGANNNNAVGVSTLTLTYSPSNGNILVLFIVTSVPVTALTVKDSNNVSLTAGPTSGSLACFYYTVSGSPTSFVAAWTTAAQVSMACEEYSGATGGVNPMWALNFNAQSSGTATISVTATGANNFIVAGLSDNTSANLTATVGTQRQTTTAAQCRISLQDNTVGTPLTAVTNTATFPSAGWNAVALELGFPAFARVEQGIDLAVIQSSIAKARIESDIKMAIYKTTTVRARMSQQVLIAVCRGAGLAPLTTAQPSFFVVT